MQPERESWDVIVVGSGAAGLAAACKAAADGAAVLLLEQADQVGGTTAISGGMVWAPGNDKAAAIGKPDTIDAARRYLEVVVPLKDRRRIDMFLLTVNEAIADLEARTSLRLQPVTTYPDYYPDIDGAAIGGRVLEPVPYDAAQLGRNFPQLRWPLPEFMLFGGMMVSRSDIPHFRKFARSWRSAARVGRLVLDYCLQRLRWRRGSTLYLGNALAAQMFRSALDLGVAVRTQHSVDLLTTDATGAGIVNGVTATDASGKQVRFRARKAVILATGGLSRRALRKQFVPKIAGDLTVTVGSGDAVCGAELAGKLGASLSDPTDQGAFWVPGSIFSRTDGRMAVYPHTVTDRAKPGLIAVNHYGVRFVNEAVSYHEFVRAQLRSDGTAVPAWLVCDRRFLWRYGLGKIKPFALFLKTDIANGYLKTGQSLSELAKAIDVPAAGLEASVKRFNTGARNGLDPEFGRGGNAYQRHLGDADQQPNPCIAPIEKPPFYSVAVWPADLGMSAGIKTDEHARVLMQDGEAFSNLFAVGNDMESVMDGAYPGPGITLGPALTFGWIAGRNAAALHTRS